MIGAWGGRRGDFWKKEWISLFIGNRTCDFLKRNECGFRDKANPSFGTINILNLRSLGSVLNELLHWFRAARRGTVKASVGDQNVSRVRWVKRGSRKGFWCEFFLFVYLSAWKPKNSSLITLHFLFLIPFHWAKQHFFTYSPEILDKLVILICRLVLDRNLLLSWLVWEQALSIYPKPEEGSQTIGDFGLRWMVVLEVTSRVMLSWIGWSVSSSFGKGSWTLVS